MERHNNDMDRRDADYEEDPRDDVIEEREEVVDVERDGRTIDPAEPAATGDVLGISQVPTGPTGEIRTPQRGGRRTDEDTGHVMPLEDEVDLGARDVTKDGRGQTGPETGGHGSTPRRSGATGMDIG